MEYICECCIFKTSTKRDFIRHVNSVKHKKCVFASSSYVCEFCGKIFNNRQAKHAHTKLHCVYKNDATTDSKDIFDTVNIQRQQLEQKDKQLEQKDKQLEQKDKQLEQKDKQLSSMIDANKESVTVIKESVIAVKESAKASVKNQWYDEICNDIL
jgi:septal ring factor EnvC (AmiA/AmiB activator)